MRHLKILSVIAVAVSILVITSITTADMKAEGTFTGTMSGNVKGSGKLSGPVSITVDGTSVSGTMAGKSSTGDNFSGKISGTYDSKTTTLQATYRGKFNRFLGGKSIGAVSIKGSLNGTFNGTKFAGKWSGRGSGTWNATGGKPIGEVAFKLLYPAGESPKVFTKGWIFGAKATYTSPDGDTSNVSDKVEWSGSGSFQPKTGEISRPTFSGPGTNTIVLTAKVDDTTFTKTFNVTAVSPAKYARVGSMAEGTCSHGCLGDPFYVVGPIQSGSPTVLINGKPAARLGDPGVHAACCSTNSFKVIEGDSNVLIDGKPAARIGDKTEHCGGYGKITSGMMATDMPETTAWKALEKEEGLKVASKSANTSTIRNTSDHLRAVEAKIAGRDIEISLMPKSSVSVAQKPKSASVNQGASVIKVLPQVPSELLVSAGGSSDQAVMEVNQQFGTMQTLHTKFVVVDAKGTSAVKVIKGAVKYTSKRTGKSVTVSAGETCTATAKGLGKVEQFDVSTEKSKWNKAENEAGISKSWFGCTLNPELH